MLGNYVITNHVLERYEQRTNKSKKDVRSRILRDLNRLGNKRIVYIGDYSYIFCRQPNSNVREFIVFKKNGKHIVTTVINRSSEDSDLAYKNRLRQKEEYEKSVK